MNNTFTKKSNTMKNISIPIKYKEEAIPLLEKLGYKEDTEFNEVSKDWENTHILTSTDGTWAFCNHDGMDNTPITIEELRELAGEPAPDKLDILIEQMRELRAELREFMEKEKTAEVREWKEGDKVRTTAMKNGHNFGIDEIVKLVIYDTENDLWIAQSESGKQWWISESEAELV